MRLVAALASTATTALLFLPPVANLAAQGVSTGAMRGIVVASDGREVDGARVLVSNTATGYRVEAEVRQGRFFVQGLALGGAYAVTVSHLGFQPDRLDGVRLRLGEPLELRFVIRPLSISLDPLAVTGYRRTHPDGGTATTVGDSLVHRLPTPDRNVYDFVRLAPHVSTRVGFQRSGVSAAGANFRFNNFLIDGAAERFVAGNVSAAFNVGKSIPIDAVEEYQVLVAPYDVRYGGFAGALINTVTRSGTNELRGSTFISWRDDRLARSPADAARAPYERLQYGFTLGGPIVRDRVHFFVAPEFQSFTSPAPGPYLGQPATATPPVPVAEEDLERFAEIMRDTYGLESGSGGAVEASSPLRNLFARIDADIPRWRSRVSASFIQSTADDEWFSRSSPDTFPLSSYAWTLATGLRVASLRVDSEIPRTGGGRNELILAYSSDWGDFVPDIRQPLVRVLLPGTSGGLVTLNAGSAEPAQGRSGRSWSLSIRDDLALPLGTSHLLRLGAQAERFSTERDGVLGGYGVWTFGGLDAFEQGVAGRYQLRVPINDASTALKGGEYAAWIGDEWQLSERFVLTTGLRADLLSIDGHAPYNSSVDSIFGRRTDRMPSARVHFSPRAGFTWRASDARGDQVRGGIGLFTGRPPLAWIAPALSSYGVGIGVLQCGLQPSDAGSPPAFEPDYEKAPTACATGPEVTSAPFGDVDLLDPRLGLAQTLRGSLAYDRPLPWGLVGTAEVLISRNVSDFRFVNLNLAGPQAVDRFGRVLYGTIGTAGQAAPMLRSSFSEVIDLTNTSKNRSVQVSGRLERQFAHGMAASLSYTYSHVRDVQSPSRLNQPGIVMWADARAVSGLHEDVVRGVSLNDIPHRVVAAATYTFPWRASTSIAFYYVGESGSPFTYIAGGAGRRGDLNADGSNANDPIYVPRAVEDPAEILFSGRSDAPGADNSATAQAVRIGAQQVAFGAFIEQTSCLRSSRGHILERNRCREPWSHTTVASIRQVVPIGGGGLEVGLDAFNLLNLLNGGWGLHRVASPVLLEQVGQTAGPSGTTQPIFRFDGAREEWTTFEGSVFQLQLTARYRF